MAVLILGLVLFLGGHAARIAAPRWREAIAARLGEGPWKGLYSLVALVGLVLAIWGYGIARRDPVILYVPPIGLRDVTFLLMAFVFPLLIATYSSGWIKSRVRHPMLATVIVWAVAHLLANGTLADLLLFGGFLLWAVLDLVSVSRRPHRPPEPEPWGPGDSLAIFAGMILYGVFLFWAHEALIGVRPIV